MPAKAGIQYSETPAMESRTRGVLDTRLRGYDGWWDFFDNASLDAAVARDDAESRPNISYTNNTENRDGTRALYHRNGHGR
jgi:hypothetical protein